VAGGNPSESSLDSEFQETPVRLRIAASILIASGTACSGAPIAELPSVAVFSIQQVPPTATPSPELRLQVQAGPIQALIPENWEARPLPRTRYPQEGFVASPRLADWQQGARNVGGIEVFWVDVAKGRIPSDYYYLVARGPAVGTLTGNKACRPGKPQVFVDHPPDLIGRRFSFGDYVASDSGTCRTKQGRAIRWRYVVAAPGFGPARKVGIPNSGLYVIIAAMSGPRADLLLKEMIESTRFGDAAFSQILKAAGHDPVAG